MPVRETSLNIPHVEKTSTKAVSAIRNWWNTFHLDKSDTNNSNTEEDEEELAEIRQMSRNLNQTLRTKQLLIDFDGGRPILSLRAPLELVNFPSISRPRWPIECEVISDIIHHIEWDPPEPEPFYQATGHERTPMPVGEQRGKVVYCIDHATKRPYFTCSRVGGSRGSIKSATSYDINQTDFNLEFESRFESGNLQKAVQVGVYDYELTLQTDMYTRKHTQWFYFRVRNMKAGVTYRFTIINLMKSSSLYSLGMRPLLYSERAAKEKGVGWQRIGSNIRYYRNCNQNTKDNNSDTITLFSLTWTLQFPYDSDTCYLAHCYPYTYSHLQHYLKHISSKPAVASYCKLRVLCHSLAGNAVYVVTITSQGVGRVEGRSKKAVVVTARVHPGETNGSWMMEGLLDFLLGDSEDAQLLRDTFVFKVVPMLNPDGVVVGNYRCSLAGRDLNRNYKTLLRDSFPCVWHTRNLVERLMAETDVVLYCDFHGHNRKNNVFMYGCNNQGDASLKLQERVFPLMMSKNASNKFSFKSCKFRVQKSKEGTGRIAMWKLGIRNSYTMEATFGGSTLGQMFQGPGNQGGYNQNNGQRKGEKAGNKGGAGGVKNKGCFICGAMDHWVNDCPYNGYARQQGKSGGPPGGAASNPPQQSIPERIGRHRRKWQVNSLMKKAGIPPSTTHSGEVSQVTLWQGCEPVKDDSLENMRAAYLHRRACHLTAGSTHTDDLGMDTGHWRCSSQLLHLSALIPPSPNVIHPIHQQHHYPQQPFVSYKVYRGHPSSLRTPHRSSMCFKMVPDIIPTKRLLSSVTNDNFNSRYIYRDRNSLRVSERYFVPEESSTSHADTTKTKRQNGEREDDPSVGLTLLRCIPLGEQNQRDLTHDIPVRETKSHSNLFVPVQRATDQGGKRLGKETCEDKRHMGVLPPVSKPSGILTMELPHPHSDTLRRLQAKGIRHHHFGRESQIRMDPQEAMVTRPSQSAPM
ncbi:cytosolic carboxypeptidase 2-like [Seriola lalandi dorsalis]|uniref:cytosolic carboxypeptidase 2-like n=1 Tax=Seriola lalandi dorsalis TaxID=1841481 RepID=UPI000C6F8B9F|nr:cytosolic carboxypeptidase 2-like [Seriola lalandi dorsalis]